MASELEQVRQAREHGAIDEALSVALQAWRATGAPEIADVIDLLAAETLRVWPNQKARNPVGFQAAWLETAQRTDASATVWLASTFARQLPITGRAYDSFSPDLIRQRYAALFARLAQLGARAPNPTIAAGVTRVVVEAQFTAVTADQVAAIYRPLLDLIVQCQDVRQVAVLEELLAHPRGRRAGAREALTQLIPGALKRLVGLRSTLDDAGRQAWRELLPTPEERASLPGSGSAQDAHALLSAIVERPEDDSVRLVYADLLTGQGDPRGEFITLQVLAARAEPRPEMVRRQKALLRDHGEAWLGDLRLVASVEFRRGFPFKIALNANAVASEEMWEAAPRLESLQTVEVLEKGRGNGEHVTSFLLSDRMRNLKSAEVFLTDGITRLCAGSPRRLEEIVFLKPVSKPALKAIIRTEALPRLKRLIFADRDCMSPPAIKTILDSGVLQKVRSIGVKSWDDSYVEDLLKKLLAPGHVDEIRVDTGGAGYAAFRREGAAIHAEIEDQSSGMSLRNLLAARNVATAAVRISPALGWQPYVPAEGEIDAMLDAARKAGVKLEVTRRGR